MGGAPQTEHGSALIRPSRSRSLGARRLSIRAPQITRHRPSFGCLLRPALFFGSLARLRLAVDHVLSHQRIAGLGARDHVAMAPELDRSVVPRDRQLRVHPLVDALGAIFRNFRMVHAVASSGYTTTPRAAAVACKNSRK